LFSWSFISEYIFFEAGNSLNTWQFNTSVSIDEISCCFSTQNKNTVTRREKDETEPAPFADKNFAHKAFRSDDKRVAINGDEAGLVLVQRESKYLLHVLPFLSSKFDYIFHASCIFSQPLWFVDVIWLRLRHNIIHIFYGIIFVFAWKIHAKTPH